MKKIALLGLAALITTIAGQASAAYDYPCRVRVSPMDYYGDYGAVYENFYSQPNCGGTYEGYATYCSAGNTTSSCSSNSSYQYGPEQLNAIAYQLTKAVSEGREISHFTTSSCSAGGSSCASYFYFSGH